MSTNGEIPEDLNNPAVAAEQLRRFENEPVEPDLISEAAKTWRQPGVNKTETVH
jgi:hypothetical protein